MGFATAQAIVRARLADVQIAVGLILIGGALLRFIRATLRFRGRLGNQ